jgi:uncharacterized protein YfcZ (UPF0381/DUF406 family)
LTRLEIIAAFSSAIEKSKPVMPDFGTLQKSLDFITKNTTDLTLEKKAMTQKILFTPGNGTKAEFIYTEPDSKGKPVEERYEFYLNDIDAGNLNFKVSGKKISVGCISVNKTKFIKYFKDNMLQDFKNEADILMSDIETARELTEAFKAAIKSSGTQPAAWKNTGEAVAYLTTSLTGETIGTDKYKLNFSAVSTEPLNIRYVIGKSDAQGLTMEQSFEFYPYMLDPASLKIVSSGKYLVVGISVSSKKSFIKVIKDGKQQSFGDAVEIMASDARQAREIADAIRYLAANGKPKDKVWSDKQSAMKFITDNVTDMKNEAKAVKQKIEMTNNDPCKISYKVSSTDDKGKTTDEIFEFALTDMNKQMVELKVSGKAVEVVLPCKNKEKLVKAYKNGEQQAWGAEVRVGTDDVEKARNISEAFKSAIGQCEK